MSEKTATQKRSAEELLTEHEPKLKKTGVLTNNRGSIKDFLDRMRSQSKLFCSVGVDCPKICNSETELSSHKESEHSTDQWKCWEVRISSNGEDGKVLNIENIEVHDIDGPRMNQWTTNIIKQYFFNHINSRIKSLPVSSIPKYALVTCGVNLADKGFKIYHERLFKWRLFNSQNQTIDFMLGKRTKKNIMKGVCDVNLEINMKNGSSIGTPLFRKNSN